jgi:hypothetical protein
MWPLGHGGVVDLGPHRWEGSAPVLRASFSVFRIKVCRGSAHVVVAAPRAIWALQLQPHLGGNVERLVGVLWSSRISYGCEDLRIIKELHVFPLLCLRDECGLLDPFDNFPFATNNVRPTQGGAAVVTHRRHGLEVEDEGLLKDLVIIFVFLAVVCTICYFF